MDVNRPNLHPSQRAAGTTTQMHNAHMSPTVVQHLDAVLSAFNLTLGLLTNPVFLCAFLV